VVIGSNITVTILAVEGGRVRVGIDAPDDIRILRGELAFWMEPDSVRVGERSEECALS
jgi:carbon storage regulator CsrA